MKKNHKLMLLVLLMNLLIVKLTAQNIVAGGPVAQNVGIGTIAPHPTAKLHVDVGTSLTDGFLVSGTFNTAGFVPDLGPGSRLMFYPGKAAFRAGTVTGLEWNNANVGQHSAALGYGNIASGANSFAAGYLAQARGVSAVAFGDEAWAFGNAATAMGSITSAPGKNSTAMGYFTNSIGEGSTAMGGSTVANGTYSTSLGLNTNAKSAGSVAMGRYNELFAASDATNWVDTDPLLILGNGTTNTARSNALVVYKNGNTDISGYTQLGKTTEAAPAIKMKKITGIGPAVNGSLVVATGLDGSKILSVQIFMQFGTTPLATRTLPPNSTSSAGNEYEYYINFSTIEILNKFGNSANIGGKPFRMLITYEE